MLYVDLKYVSLVGSTLRNFKQKNKTLFNCSCPICGDSEKKRSKARGFFYQHNNTMCYKCHNCSAGMGIGNFLKTVFPNYYDEYIFEKYKHGVENTKTKDVAIQLTKVTFNTFKSDHAIKLSELDDLHYAKQYVVERKIPPSMYSKIYFTPDFAAVVDEVFPGKYTNLTKNDPRLVIPFFDSQNGVIGLQGRTFLRNNSLRYITIRASNNTDLVYGLDRVDLNNTVYVVEGPIDSMFLPNCVAAANSDLASVVKKIGAKNGVVLVYDNEPRNKEIVKLIEKAISSGNQVCIWPNGIIQKDVNDIILSGKTPDEVCAIIHDRTFSGLQAELEFSRWKKI